MLLPQPSFPLAVLSKSHAPASILLLSAKLLMMVYLWREYRLSPLACLFKRRQTAQRTDQFSEEIETEMLETQARVQ